MTDQLLALQNLKICISNSVPFACLYLRHPLAVFGLQALFGLLEVGVLVLVGGRLQVVVHGVGGAGRGCGYYKRGGEKETVERRGFFIVRFTLKTRRGLQRGLLGLVRV